MNFGYFSPALQAESWWNRWNTWLPESTRYAFGPLKAGTITGVISGEKVHGWGWKVPLMPNISWSLSQKDCFWKRVTNDIVIKDIKVLGIDPTIPLKFPDKLLLKPGFPGVTDGKNLETILFIHRFRTVFRYRSISPQNAQVVIVWQEGNLGLTCARLIANDIRFLTLIHPNNRVLEQAAAMIYSESGISPIIATRLTEAVSTADFIIQCGKISHSLIDENKVAAIKFKLFQGYPLKSLLNLRLPIDFSGINGQIPLSTVLGETLLRAAFDLATGYWVGTELKVEHVVLLAKLLNNVGVRIVL